MPRHGPGARGLRRDCHADAYMAAFEAETLSERWALMAIAEAKFLESGVATPMYTAGGCYAMSRVPFRAGGYASWLGDRVYFDQMVITNEIISTEDYEHIVEMWYELTGTGTYTQSAVDYLTEKGYTFTDTATTTFDRVGTTMVLNTAQLEMAKKDGNFDKYVHVAPNVTNIFLMWFNENRQVYANVPDGACVSSKTEAQKEVSRAALQNQHFRLALGGMVELSLIECQDATENLNAWFNTNSGAEYNYDLGGLGGIGADFGDPETYLDGLLPYGDGFAIRKMGLW